MSTIKVHIVAYQVVENVQIKKFRSEYTGELISSSSFELFYRYKAGYIYILNYGIVVFADVDEIDRSNFIRLLKSYGERNIGEAYQEDFIIEKADISNPIFSYNSLSISEINSDIIRVVMLQVAQSAALDFYLEKSQQIFDETARLTTQLEIYGKLKGSKKMLLHIIGKALNTKNKIINDLYVIDAPPSVWENELLGKVNDGLNKVFDINTRFKEIEYMLKSVESNLSIFIELIDTKVNQRLEWIIIILILIEVIHFTIVEIFQ